MRFKKAITAIILAIPFMGIAQNKCSNYYPLEEGIEAQITTYDKRDEVASIVDYSVVEVTSSGNATVATINSKIKDDSNEVITETNYKVTCEGNALSIDFQSLISPQLFEQFENMEYEVSGTNLEIPNELLVGDALPDANVTMQINMGGINMNMNLDMTDRKVVSKETVTTPAGTFDCKVITYSLDMKMGMNRSGSGKQWIAEGVGMVKQEDYNRRGKVTSRSLLTEFSK